MSPWSIIFLFVHAPLLSVADYNFTVPVSDQNVTKGGMGGQNNWQPFSGSLCPTSGFYTGSPGDFLDFIFTGVLSYHIQT